MNNHSFVPNNRFDLSKPLSSGLSHPGAPPHLCSHPPEASLHGPVPTGGYGQAGRGGRGSFKAQVPSASLWDTAFGGALDKSSGFLVLSPHTQHTPARHCSPSVRQEAQRPLGATQSNWAVRSVMDSYFRPCPAWGKAVLNPYGRGWQE